MLKWDDEAWWKYEELRDRADADLDNALEDALDLIQDNPHSADARQSRLESAESQTPIWIVDAPPRYPVLRIFWRFKDGDPTIAHIAEEQ